MSRPNPVTLPWLQSMIPERNLFGDGANYGVPLAPRISDSTSSVYSFGVPAVGAAPLDSTVGPSRQALSGFMLGTELLSLVVLTFGQRMSVSRRCATPLRLFTINRNGVHARRNTQ